VPGGEPYSRPGILEVPVIGRPVGMGQFHFVTVVRLRAVQLMRGCTPKVELNGSHKATVIAQMEVAQGKIAQSNDQELPADQIAIRLDG
jgi:DNA-directed RNA polymerase subunit K/omega